MSSLTLRVLKARHGDSMFLFGDKDGVKTSVLIDGGPRGVFRSVLKKQLQELPRDQNEPPVLDLLVVSHIDDDHINGILELTDELIEAEQEDREPLVHIRQAWHNSFSDLILEDPSNQSHGQIINDGGEAAGLIEDLFSNQVGSHFEDTEMILASVKQGRNLRLNLEALSVRSNSRFENGLIVLPSHIKSRSRTLNRSLKVKFIGPRIEELEDLRDKWRKELPKILDKESDGRVAATRSLDTSVANLASLVFIAELDGKRILFTGDARGDKIIEWLERSGELDKDDENSSVNFDVVKLPHHGSDRNVDDIFFKRVIGDHYVVSGNGGHGNPEPETFRMLFEARKGQEYKIHMTYNFDELSKSKSYMKHDNHKTLTRLIAEYGAAESFRFVQGTNKFLEILI